MAVWLHKGDGDPIAWEDETSIEAALLSEQPEVFLAAGAKIPVIAPDGRVGVLPAESALEAFRAGWVYDTPGRRAQLEDASRQREIASGASGALKATGAAVARGASFGLSDPLLAALPGITARDLDLLRQAHPELSLGGEVAGALAPAVLSGGTGAVGTAARLAPAGAAARVGLGAENLALRALGQGAGRRAVARGVGAGVEMIPFAAGQELSAATLEARDISPEKLVAGIGTSALLGAGLTSSLSLLGSGARTAFSAATLRKQLPKALGDDASAIVRAQRALEADAAEDPTGLIGKLAETMIGKDRYSAIRRTVLDPARRKLAHTEASDVKRITIELADGLTELDKRTKGTADHLLNVVKKSEIDAGLSQVDPARAAGAGGTIADGLSQAIRKIEGEPHIFLEAPQLPKLKALEGFLRDTFFERVKTPKKIIESGEATLEDLFVPKEISAKEAWNALDTVRGKLNEIVRQGNRAETSIEQRATVAKVNEIGEAVQKVLEAESLWGSAAAAQSRHNAVYSRFLSARDKVFDELGFLAGKEKGRKSFGFAHDDVGKLFGDLGDPSTENARRSLQGYLGRISEVGALADDAAFAKYLDGSMGKIVDAAALGKALSDAKILKGQATTASELLGSAISRYGIGAAAGFGLGGPMGAAAGVMLQRPVGRLVLRAIEKIVDDRTTLIRTYSMAIAKGTRAVTAGRPAILTPLRALEMARFDDTEYERPARDKREAFLRRSSELSRSINGWEKTEARIRQKLEPMMELPDGPALIDASVAQAKKKLAYAMMEHPPVAETSPLASPVTRAKARLAADDQIDAFSEVVQALEDPVSVLGEVMHGRASIRAAKALATVDPELYAEMREELAMAFEAEGREPTYPERLRLSIFFGAALDPSQAPANVLIYQETYDKAPGADAADAASSKSGKLKSARSATTNLKSIKEAASAATRLEGRGPITSA